jgi:flagellar hook-associated protein 2
LGISFGSINTGLPKDIVQQIMQAEKIPLQKFDERKDKLNSKKTLLNDLSSRIEKLKGLVLQNKTARSLRELKVTTSNDAISASADKNIASPGSYNIEVIELAQKSSAISNGVKDKDKTYTGVGYIKYNLPNGETKSVYIDKENANLTGIAKLINKDDSNGMKATVVDSGDGSKNPWKIIISLEHTGANHMADFPHLYLVDGEVDLFFQGERPAKNAKIKLDGFEIELSENQTADIIPGVNINLKKAKPGEEINIEITEDKVKINEKVQSIVDSINDVLKFIKEQNTLDESTDTSRTLGGDLTLQTIESRIRSAVFQNIKLEKGGTKRVGDIGITFQRDGLLALDQSKLDTELQSSFMDVAQVITGSFSLTEGKIKGFVDFIEDVTNGALARPNGTVTSRKEGIDSQIRQIDQKIERKQVQLERKEQTLKSRFARLEETMSRIQTQGAGLAGLSSMANPITQLG